MNASLAENSNRANFLHHLKLREQGKTTYLEMSKGLAQSCIEKWTVHPSKPTVTFCDQAGAAMLVETIK